jgi:ribonuclease P/MRP protein subunit POP5
MSRDEMKPILPSLKEKKRYIVFEVISEKKLSKSLIEKAINEQVLKFLGELGVAKSGFLILKDLYKKNKGVVKTNVKYQDEVKMALSLIKKIGNEKAIVNVIGVSGILNKAKSKFMEGD